MVKIGNVTLGEFPLLLAPMEDVSDPPFRRLCKKYGADMLYSEFISSEGLIRDAIKSRKKLDIFDDERPVGIQIFGGDEEAMAPVTVKTRLGWDSETINIEEVAERLQDVGIQALSIHARTRVQMYKGHSDWSYIAKVKNNSRIHIPIFGNGDIDSPEKALEYKERYGVDGIMIGRAAIGYPWIFQEIKHYIATRELLPPPTLSERAEAALQHLLWAVEWKGERLGILETRRHYSNYFKGIPHFKEYKQQLVTLDDLEALKEILIRVKSEIV